jgi:hypothetical protein
VRDEVAVADSAELRRSGCGRVMARASAFCILQTRLVSFECVVEIVMVGDGTADGRVDGHGKKAFDNPITNI